MSPAASSPHLPKKKRGDTYVIDQENVSEMARLLEQNRLVTEAMGGVFPPAFARFRIHRVLDLACGPGGWALAVAETDPSIQVTGLDISRLLMTYARRQARMLGLPNAHFQAGDITRPLKFPDASFDLVNGRLLFSLMQPTKWPKLVAECWRVLRPGGLLRLTESELSITSSSAFERLADLFALALTRVGQSFSPNGRTIGITPRLRPLLRDAGFHHIQQEAYAIDWSTDAPAHPSTKQDFLSGLKLVQPFLISTDVTTEEETEQLYEQAVADMEAPDFCAIWFYLSVWGTKPPGNNQ